jgi:hypothetical protein
MNCTSEMLERSEGVGEMPERLFEEKVWGRGCKIFVQIVDEQDGGAVACRLRENLIFCFCQIPK